MPFVRPSLPFLAAVAIRLLVALPGVASAASLADNDQAEVKMAEEYLNAVNTLKAHFLQISPSGGITEGTFYLSRPGHMRLEYDPPSPVLVIVDSNWLIYYDKQLQQTSYMEVDSTPVGMLVKPRIKLDGDDLKVTRVSRHPGVLGITLIKKSNPSEGQITLVFAESPLALKQWQVIDQEGVTKVTLSDAHIGISLNDDLFDFRDPQFTGQPYQPPQEQQ